MSHWARSVTRGPAAGANFTFAYTAIGFSPDGARTWLLPRRSGYDGSRNCVDDRRIDARELRALAS